MPKTSEGLELSRALASALCGDPSDLSPWPVEELAAAAATHGITALLWATAAGRESLQPLRRALDDRVQLLAAEDLFRQRDIRAVLDALAESSVPALLVKGAALAYTIYPDPYARPRSDTDILVRLEDVDAAARALVRCGHTPTGRLDPTSLLVHQMKFERTDHHGVYQSIDLHWKLANPHLFADALPFELLWEGRQPSPGLGPDARIPSPVGSVLLACMHRAAHHQHHERLIWLYDLKLLTAVLTGPEWRAIRTLACDRGLAAVCLSGLRRARNWLEATLPVEIEEALAAAPREATAIYTTGPVPQRDVLISDLRVLGRWQARARLLQEHVFPPPSRMRQRYGRGTRWLLPVLYLHRLLKAIWRWVRE